MQILKNSDFLSQEVKEKEISVLAGPNGVGKTEVALNLASFFCSLGRESYLLDLILPKVTLPPEAPALFFLSQLSILPRGKGRYADTPLWDEEIFQVLSQLGKTHRLIVDLGGDLKGMKVWRSLQSFGEKEKFT